MTTAEPFRDRRAAGEELASALQRFSIEDAVVVGLTRGGVAVAEPIARALQAPLDMLVVQKMGSPAEPELGVGAFAEGDVQVIDTVLCDHLGIPPTEVRRLTQAHAAAFDARVNHYRRHFPRIDLRGKTAIVVDDGLATGSTAHAAVRSARRASAHRIVLAVPVGSRSAVDRLAALVDEVVCLRTPDDFRAVGTHYASFPQLSDEAMLDILDKGTRHDVTIPVADAVLHAVLDSPPAARLLVIFAHGSGSSRFSPRNNEVARILNDAGIATLLVDLLTADEADIRSHVFDIEHLADRLEGVVAWTRTFPQVQHMGVALFGASTGAAAAIAVAARCPDIIRSVVSRGGRPDLARHWLPLLEAPTLFIVGGDDVEVLRLNRDAMAHLTCPVALDVIPGAGHLFEEPGALVRVATRARDWFTNALAARAA
jgi:putative phosphoribosyl transferase